MRVNDDRVIQRPRRHLAGVRGRLGEGPRQGGLPRAKHQQRTGYRTYFQASKRHKSGASNYQDARKVLSNLI